MNEKSTTLTIEQKTVSDFREAAAIYKATQKLNDLIRDAAIKGLRVDVVAVDDGDRGLARLMRHPVKRVHVSISSPIVHMSPEQIRELEESLTQPTITMRD